MSADPYSLQRFVDAQAGGVYDRALAELRAGQKRGHWMWFVFPQVAGLGRSAMSERYAIGSLAEGRAYLDHPTLGPRIRECAAAVRDVGGSAEELLGPIDEEKLRSSMTLFEAADPDDPVFGAVLDRLYGGARCRQTLTFVAEHP